MHYPVHVRFCGMDASLALITAAKTHACALPWARSLIFNCWVGIHHDADLLPTGKPYSVRVDVLIRGRELVVHGAQHHDAHLALSHAIEDMKQQLDDIELDTAYSECGETVNGQLA